MDELPYRYYVTYTALNDAGLVRGAIDITRADPVTDYAEVRLMADLIAEHGVRDVVISNWRLYDAPAKQALEEDDD